MPLARASTDCRQGNWEMRRLDSALALFFVANLVALVPGLVFAAGQRNQQQFVIYSVLTAAVIVFVYALSRQRRKQAPASRIFHVGIPDQESVWIRDAQASRVINALRESGSELCVLCGESGAGKSVLVKTQVLPALADCHWEIVHIEEYDNLTNRIHMARNALRRSFGNKALVIFDQAERLVDRPAEDQESVKRFIQNTLKLEVKILLVTREDFYYRLRFLGGLLPRPSDAIELPGIDEPAELAQVSDRFRQVCDPDCFATVLEELQQGAGFKRRAAFSPLELQMIGLMLELAHSKRGKKVDRKYYQRTLQGKSELNRSFFAAYVGASPDPHIAHSALCGLSTDARIRKSLTLDQLSGSSFYSAQEIAAALGFFAEHGLIVMPSKTSYEWAHDLLAERFREYAAAELDPALRDNIEYRVEARARQNYRSNVSDTASAYRAFFWNSIQLLIILGVLFRIFLPEWFSDGRPEDVTSRLYVAVGVALLGWAVYLARLFKGFFVRVAHGPLLPDWSVGLAALGLAVYTCFQPRYWIVAISVLGCLVGINFILVSLGRNLAGHAAKRLRRNGVTALTTCLFFGSFGWAYTPILDLLPDAGMKEAATIGLACFVVLLAGVATVHYTSRQSTEILLGLVDRRRAA